MPSLVRLRVSAKSFGELIGKHLGSWKATEMYSTPFAEAVTRVQAGADPWIEAGSLVSAMTAEEKLGSLDGDTPFWPGLANMTSGGYHEHPWPAAAVERLGIPGLQFSDGPRGCVTAPATCFPVSMARGASFDPELERRIGDAIGKELRAAGANYTGAVCMNLLRHPAWGRAQETYGEDPHHVGEMAAALTDGLQNHVMACMKHYALNSMENGRFTVDITIDERSLHEVYLPHFKRVADAGVASVMSAYNSVNGEWCGENSVLLNDILRDEWQWKGFVTSDFVFGLRDAVKSVKAGLNIEMPFRQQRELALTGAVADGSLEMAVVELRVQETLAAFLRFNHVFGEAPSAAAAARVLASAEHIALAHEAAIASMVLLRNDALLPVSPTSVKKVAVLGRLAAVANLGDGGSSNVFPPYIITPLDGLRIAYGESAIMHSDSDASIAADADLVVVVVGYTKHEEGEWLDQSGTASMMHLFPPMDHPELGFGAPSKLPQAAADGTNAKGETGLDTLAGDRSFVAGGDRSSLRLSDTDEALIAAVSALSKRVVVCVMSGSAVVMPWLETTAATLMIWYPGMEGGRALADVLTGVAEPAGRLPFAVPTDESQLVHFDKDAVTETYGLLHGQWWLDAHKNKAHLPFGFGLGYTNFALVSAERGALGQNVSVTVRNEGSRAGSTVLQVYASVPGSAFERPQQRIVGFAKVFAEGGATASVSISLDLAQLNIRSSGKWLTEALPVVLTVGQHAHDPAALTI
jgi:beta-glucosidase